MAVRVTYGYADDQQYVIFPDGMTFNWVDGYLWVESDSKTIAVFAKGEWTYAAIEDYEAR